jgi:cytochrome c oxidase assembly factor CtaG
MTYREPDRERFEETEREKRALEAEQRADDVAAVAAMKSPFRVRRGWRFGLGMLAFVVVGALALPLLYAGAITVAPARTADGHPVMPIGQAGFALVFSPLVAAYLVARPRAR